MYLDEIPPELALLQKLEQLILIAERTIFKNCEKFVLMPKGIQRKIRGAIYNVGLLTVLKQTC